MKSAERGLFSDQDMELKFDKKAIVAVILLILFALVIAVPVLTGLAGSNPSSSQSIYYNSYSNNTSDGGARKAPLQDFTWIIYPLSIFAGYFVIVASKKYISLAKSDLGLAFSLGGTLLIFISLLVLVWLTSFLQIMGNELFLDNFIFAFLIKFLIFFIIGFILFFVGTKINAERIPYIVLFSFVILPTLFLLAVALLGAAIRDLITYNAPSWANVPLTFVERFAWVLTVILLTIFIIIIVRHLWKTAGKNALNAFVKSLKIAGWIFSIVALVVFIVNIVQFDFANFDYSNFIKFVFESVGYGVIGGLCLLGVEKFKPLK